MVPGLATTSGSVSYTHLDVYKRQVYAWQMSGGEVGAVIEQFAHEQAHEIADLEYFDDLVRGVVRHRATLDVALVGYLDRPVEEVDPIERAVLRLSAYELLHLSLIHI